MRRLINYFIRGVVVTAPLALTLYVCWYLFHWVDQWLGLPIPGAGFYADDRFGAVCGTGKVDPGTTVVRCTVPFRLDTRGGWIIRREGFGARPGPTLLTT